MASLLCSKRQIGPGLLAPLALATVLAGCRKPEPERRAPDLPAQTAQDAAAEELISPRQSARELQRQEMNKLADRIVHASLSERPQLETQLARIGEGWFWPQLLPEVAVVQQVAETPDALDKPADEATQRYVRERIDQLAKKSLSDKDKDALFAAFALSQNVKNPDQEIGDPISHRSRMDFLVRQVVPGLEEVVNLLGGEPWLQGAVQREVSEADAYPSTEGVPSASLQLAVQYYTKIVRPIPGFAEVVRDPTRDRRVRKLYLEADVARTIGIAERAAPKIKQAAVLLLRACRREVEQILEAAQNFVENPGQLPAGFSHQDHADGDPSASSLKFLKLQEGVRRQNADFVLDVRMVLLQLDAAIAAGNAAE